LQSIGTRKPVAIQKICDRNINETVSHVKIYVSDLQLQNTNSAVSLVNCHYVAENY